MRRLILSAALLLSACGGGGNGGYGDVASPPDPLAPPPATAADVFLSAVQAKAGMSSEESEPTELDTLAATMPEDSEPAPL
ncbi:hypothetical protein [Massilia sp. erpn]|uniref:hypothetical protein n=1 Tax=Massilia sp. erpn TaxID=2738142 RepID=UPI002105D095|nr:hypothetical protein [Massilia sp. erpn]UTY59631.1 hypothetical protein HPQ68_22115 [Massilia sp. erpn]